jgi:hypothetical protein
MAGGFIGTKVGRLWDDSLGGTNSCRGYFPCLVDTTDLVASVSWPWQITVLASTDHASTAPEDAGITLFGCKTGTNAALVASWETYEAARTRGAFTAWESATGQTAAAKTDSKIYIDPDSGDAETPCVRKIGSTYYMTYHDQISGDNQPTRMATATNGLLNWTRISNADNGKVINGGASPGTTYPVGPDTGGAGPGQHRGYFIWNAKGAFSDFPYNYMGVLQHGGDTGTPWAIYGHNSPESGTAWTYVTNIGQPLAFDGTALSQNWSHQLNVATDAGGGEICVPNFRSNTYFTRDFSPVSTRTDALKIFDLGGPGDFDEAFLDRPAFIVDPGDASRYICIYRGLTVPVASNVDGHVMLATAVFDETVAKPTSVAFPNHDKYIFDARSASAWPSWLTETVGTSTFSASGALLGTNGTGSIVHGPSFDPATTDWAELFIVEASGNSAVISTSAASIEFADSNNATAAIDQLALRAQGTGASTGQVEKVWKADNVVEVNRVSLSYCWQETLHIGRRHRHGLRFDVANKKAWWLIGGRTLANVAGAAMDFSANTTLNAAALYPRFRAVNERTWRIERVELRIGTSGAGVRPTISSAIASASAVTLTFDQDCIGDGTGITVKQNGIGGITGTWTRPTLTTAVFTRSSGTFSGTLTYDISSTDIRNEADLVALADVTGSSITPEDQTGPILQSAEVGEAPDHVLLNFDEAVTFGANGNEGFVMTASGGAVTLTYVSGDGTTQLRYDTSRALGVSETMTLAYTQPGSPAGNGVEDVFGNELVDFADFAVTYESGALPIESATIAGRFLIIEFFGAFYGSEGFTLDLSGGAAPLTYYGGQGTDTLVYTIGRTVFANETGTADYDWSVGDIVDSDGVRIPSFSAPVVIAADTNPPVAISAAVASGGEVITIQFDEPVTSSASPLSFTGFTLETSGGSAVMSYDSGSGTRTLSFTVSRPIAAGETVRVAYSPGTVVDLDGNALRTMGLAVANGSTVSEVTFDDPKKGALSGAWWNVLAIPAGSINTAGAEDPDFDADTGTLLFDAATAEKVVTWFQLPNGWTEGSVVYPVVRWAKTTSATGAVAWQVRYRYANSGEALSAWSGAQVVSATETVDEDTADEVQITQLARVSIPTGRIGMMLGLEITRAAANAADTYAADARLFDVGLMYKANQAGSDQLYAKYRDERNSDD